jgi:hypothetical protein
VNKTSDYLSIPAERAFPHGQLEARRDAVVAAVAADLRTSGGIRGGARLARRLLSRSWFALIAFIAVLVVVAVAVMSAQDDRLTGSRAVVITAATAFPLAVVAVSAPSRPFEDRRGDHQKRIAARWQTALAA